MLVAQSRWCETAHPLPVSFELHPETLHPETLNTETLNTETLNTVLLTPVFSEHALGHKLRFNALHDLKRIRKENSTGLEK